LHQLIPVVRTLELGQVGNKVLELDERLNPTYCAYDQADRVRMIQDAGDVNGVVGQTYFGWDAAGSMRMKTDADGRLTSIGYYGYDASRRPTTEMHSTDGWLYYTYDSLGNLTTLQNVETGTFTSDYDALNRLMTKRTLAGANYMQYDRSGRRTLFIGPTGTTDYHTYDAAGRLTEVVLEDPVAVGSRFT
jgi:YD repeat-containing protein